MWTGWPLRKTNGDSDNPPVARLWASGSTWPVTGWGAYARAATSLLFGRLPGFLVPIAAMHVFGATPETDAFFLAWGVLGYYSGCWSTLAEVVWVPYLVRLHETRGSTRNYLRMARRWSLITCLAFALGMGILGSSGVLTARAPSISTSDVLLYLLLLSVHALLSSQASILVGLLVAQGRYGVAFLPGGITSLVTVLLVLGLGNWGGVPVLAAGYIVGEAVRVFVLGCQARSPRNDPSREDLSTSDYGMRPLIASSLFQIMSSLVLGSHHVLDRIWAGELGEGAISLLSYAERLWLVPVVLLTGGILSVKLVEWSASATVHEGPASLRRVTLRAAVKMAVVGLIPAALVFGAKAPLLRVLIGVGRLDVAAAVCMVDILAAYIVGLPLYLVGVLYARGIVVLGKTQYLLGISVVQIALKAILNMLFSEWWGVVGLALSTSVMYALGALLAGIWFLTGCGKMLRAGNV